MNKISASNYRWFLKFYREDHQCLAEDYAGMQKVITLFEAFIHPQDTALDTQLRALRTIIGKSQHVNHRAQTSIHHRLQSLKMKQDRNLFKRLVFGSSLKVELGLCYLILQEEEQVAIFLKTQHSKLKEFLKQMYEPTLLKQLSRVDIGRIQSLEIFLRRARAMNKEVIRDCKHMRQFLKEHTPNEIPTTSFQSLMQHCKSWGAKEYTIPVMPKSLFTRIREQCTDFWEVCVFLWD